MSLLQETTCYINGYVYSQYTYSYMLSIAMVYVYILTSP